VTREEDRGDGIVPVGKDVRLDGYAFPDCAFGRKSAAIDARRDVLDNDPDCAHAGVLLPSDDPVGASNFCALLRRQDDHG
jgi:hypothetical protein